MHWMCRLSDGGFCLGLLENKFITPYANGSSKMHHFSSGANLAKAVPRIMGINFHVPKYLSSM